MSTSIFFEGGYGFFRGLQPSTGSRGGGGLKPVEDVGFEGG